MGHSRIGKLPATRQWQQVVQLISGGADASAIAGATANAAKSALVNAGADPLLRHAFWLLTQIPLAARSDDFAAALRELGLDVRTQPTLAEICGAVAQSLDLRVQQFGRLNDFAEIAQVSAVETLSAVADTEESDLFGPGDKAAKTRVAFAAMATVKNFGKLARDFFSRVVRRCLDYFLSRELSNHVGVNRRFHSIIQHQEFEEAVHAHCHETALIMRDYAGEWFSKANHMGGISERKAGLFVRHAFDKIRSELSARQASPQYA